VDRGGRNSLHHLLESFPNIEGVKLLVRKGVDVHGRDSDGNTPLAAYLSDQWAVNAQICRFLLLNGSNTSVVNDHGLALPHLLSNWSDPDVTILKILMEFGVDLAARDRNGRTFLHHSAIKGCITQSILSFVLGKTMLRCDDRDYLGKTPMQYATEEYENIALEYAAEKTRKEHQELDCGVYHPLPCQLTRQLLCQLARKRCRWGNSLGILSWYGKST
jgi:ankyrin repeat protein